MRRLHLFLVLCCLVFGLSLANSATAATIVWVADNKDPENTDPVSGGLRNLVWVDLLEANGHTVDRSFLNEEGRTLDEDKIETLNAADLVIIGRDTDSGSYANGSEVTQWNSIEKPLILQVAHIMRSTRWKWMKTSNTSNTTTNMLAVLPTHPIFQGVTLEADYQVAVVTDLCTVTNHTDPGNGTLIGKRFDNDGVWIAEWSPGQEFYPGSGQFAAGPRLFFAAGHNGDHRDGQYNLTPEGERMFLNAVNYMLGVVRMTAADPNPFSGAIVDESAINLSWTPGAKAASHDIYLGEILSEVESGTGNTFRGNKATPSLTVGLTGFPYPDGLVAGRTYYWRVDEINEAEADSPWKGDVWSFTLPVETARAPIPADGSAYIDPETDLSWGVGLNATQHTVYFGTDHDVVANATEGFSTDQTSYDPGTMEYGITYYWRVDEVDGDATHKGDIWSFTIVPDILVEDPNLLMWWKFDEAIGGMTPDFSGHSRHGIVDGATFTEEGHVRGALDFGGDGDQVIYYDRNFLNGLGALTVSVWIKADETDSDRGFFIGLDPSGNDDNGMRYDATGNNGGGSNVLKMSVISDAGNQQLESSSDLQTTLWQHCAMVWNAGQDIQFYVNGVLDTPSANNPGTGTETSDFTKVVVGRGGKDQGPLSWDGRIDDFRIYDKALTAEDIQLIMRGELDLAWKPEPSDGEVLQIMGATALEWASGDFALQHDVYFSTNWDAVKNADTNSPEYKGRQGATNIPLTSLVELGGGTYYWRIDEINADTTISVGHVWRFTVVDYIAIDEFEDYNNEPPDRVFETWIDGFGTTNNGSIAGYPYPYFLAGEHFCETTIIHGGEQSMPLFFNNNMKYSEVTRTLTAPIRDWTQSGVNTLSLWYYGHPPAMGGFTEGPAGTHTMSAAGADIWAVDDVEKDQFHFAWKMLRGTGSITARIVSVTETDTWTKAGVMIRETLDPNSTNAFVLVAHNSNRVRMQYRPTPGGITAASGDVLDITIQPHWIRLTRDLSGNFTAFHASDVGGTPGNWEIMVTEAVQMNTDVYIGLALTSHAEGVQATAVFSDVTMTGNITGTTFNHEDIGIQSNDPERMYVSLKDGSDQIATVYNPDPNAALITSWTEWGQYGEGIQLTAFTAANPSLNLSDIDTVSLGFGTKGATLPGGSGMVFFDDIRLFGSRCITELGQPAGDLSDNCVVDMPDLEIMVDQWLQTGPDIEADLNSDEIVDFKDYAELIATWLEEQLWP